MNLILKRLWLSNFVIWIVLCGYLNANSDIYTESFPGGSESEKLEVSLLFNYPFYTKMFIRCRDFNSLRYFRNQQNHLENFTEISGIQIEFVDCFNNVTDNENYNYNLMSSLTNLINFKTTKVWTKLQISLNEYAIVNSDRLFNDFNFGKFEDISFDNVGFKSAEFLHLLRCIECTFVNTNLIDFNDFANETGAIVFTTKFNKLLKFNKSNLKKFNLIRKLTITNFDMDDYNVFNTPGLFEHNPDLSEVTIEDSKGKITLHERVFSGLSYLYSLTLQDLHLDSIHKNLFQDLSNLRSVFLSSNNIKRIEPNTFQNNVMLSFATITDNPIFTEHLDEIESFKLGNIFSELWLSNFTIHTVNVLEPLMNHTQLRKIVFQSLLINPIDLTVFTNFQLDRETPITIRFLGDRVALNLVTVRSAGFTIKTEKELKQDKLNVLVKLPISDGEYCSNCAMIKQIFSYYLNNYKEQPGFYFERSRVLVIPDIQDACHRLEDVFDENFAENCPLNCDCKYNRLMDKIKIGCNNKNLTEIPSIAYPVQFNNVQSIELHFVNNSLSNLSLAGQDENVLKKLSTIVVRNNKIESVSIDYGHAKYVKVLDLCNNPIVAGNKSVYIDGIPTFSSGFNEYFCRFGTTHPDAPIYIQDVKSTELEGLLNDLKCN